MTDQIRVDMKSALGDTILSSGGGKSEPAPALVSTLEGKYVILYFSASWCGPCRNFTPRLAKVYESLNASGKPVEVVFISLDKTEDDFQAYLGKMPWKAVPHQGAIQVAKSFSVTTIPRLMVLGPDHRILNADAVQRVVRDPEGKEFPWEGETPFW